MATQLIEIQEKPRAELETWAYMTGTKVRIREVAIELLASLRFEEGKTKARVYIDGSQVQAKQDEIRAAWNRSLIDEEGTNDASEN